MNKREQATGKRYEAAAQRLARGESESDVYRALYPKSRHWKMVALYPAASRLAAKVTARVQEIQAAAAGDAIIDIKRRKQILSDIIEARVTEDKASDDGVLQVGPDFRTRIASIAELNKMEGVYAPEKFEGDIQHLMVMREPRPAPVRRKKARRA